MKLWQRKKRWIKDTSNYLINTYLWFAFFQQTCIEMCYIAWNCRKQKQFINQEYDWYNSKFHWYN